MLSGRSSFASQKMMLKKTENNDESLLDTVGNGETVRQRPTVLHLTLLTFMELAEDGEHFLRTAKARQDFPQSIMANSIKSP